VTVARTHELPTYAAWRQCGAREGFEVVFFRLDADGCCATGHATAVEGEQAWAINYRIRFDRGWLTRSARVRSSSFGRHSAVELATNGRGEWVVDRVPAPELDGCLDVDLEGSVFTNALPVNRLRMSVGATTSVPAAYVRTSTLRVERLEQSYSRLPSCTDGTQRYEYHAHGFAFFAELTYDEYGLLLTYPGIGSRRA